MSSGTNKKLEAALELANKGFCIFPLHNPVGTGCSCGRADCPHVGKHPRIPRWPQQATADSKLITAWFTKSPDANIGIVTGKESGIFVLDVDNKVANSGERSLEKLIKIYSPLPVTLTAKTGAGRHFYFKLPVERVKNSAGIIAPGLDVRGQGGYAVAPPSLHSSGNVYEWLNPDVAIAEAPAWLLDLVTTETVSTTAAAEDEKEGEIPEGSRNNQIFKAVCGLLEHAMSKNDVLLIAMQMNQQKCKPPLDESEVRSIVESAARYDCSQTKSVRPVSRRSPLYWFPLYVEEYLTDPVIMGMKDHQLGWHFKLIMYCWKTGGILTDPKTLAALLRVSPGKFERERGVVLYGFEEKILDGKKVLIHNQLSEMYVDALEKWMQKKEAGIVRQQASKLQKLSVGFPSVYATAVN